MKNGYAYVAVCVAIVSIGIFIIYETLPKNSSEPLESKTWVEIDLTFCQKTPWDEWMSSHPNVTVIPSEPRQPQIIKSYFHDLGITIFDMKTTFVETTIYMPCDAHYADFFLVSESNADKMTKLGYKITELPLPPNIRQIGY